MLVNAHCCLFLVSVSTCHASSRALSLRPKDDAAIASPACPFRPRAQRSTYAYRIRTYSQVALAFLCGRRVMPQSPRTHAPSACRLIPHRMPPMRIPHTCILADPIRMRPHTHAACAHIRLPHTPHTHVCTGSGHVCRRSKPHNYTACA